MAFQIVKRLEEPSCQAGLQLSTISASSYISASPFKGGRDILVSTSACSDTIGILSKILKIWISETWHCLVICARSEQSSLPCHAICWTFRVLIHGIVGGSPITRLIYLRLQCRSVLKCEEKCQECWSPEEK